MATIEEIRAVVRFLTKMVEVEGRIIIELLKPTGGAISDETKDAIHEQLRRLDLDDAALRVPAGISALRGLDLLWGLFPPPNPRSDDTPA